MSTAPVWDRSWFQPPRPEGPPEGPPEGRVMPAEFVDVLEKGTKHLPAFACEED